jgi:hypothetical protein
MGGPIIASRRSPPHISGGIPSISAVLREHAQSSSIITRLGERHAGTASELG